MYKSHIKDMTIKISYLYTQTKPTSFMQN